MAILYVWTVYEEKTDFSKDDYTLFDTPPLGSGICLLLGPPNSALSWTGMVRPYPVCLGDFGFTNLIKWPFIVSVNLPLVI